MRHLQLHDYDIQFDNNGIVLSEFLSGKNYSAIYILTDENTSTLCLPLIEDKISNFTEIKTNSGESHKNLVTCSAIWEKLNESHADRKAVLLNLGGGVIGDMGGFAASCYKRGIDFINIPTTLLSQVDSSIGGKLGIDLNYGKNLIGLFNNPELVIISSSFFKTLPQRQYVNGWAEIFKHALIKNKSQWEIFSIIDIFNCEIEEIVFQSLKIKKEVVEADPYEKGVRKILNFGHTIGHAIESYSLEKTDNPLLHGEAIVIGMITESWIATQRCGLKNVELDEIKDVLLKHFPKHNISDFDFETLYKLILTDKKNEQNKIKMALINEIGNCLYDIEVDKDLIRRALDYYAAI